MDLSKQILDMLLAAAGLGAIVSGMVEVLRTRLPKLDGWVVLPVVLLMSAIVVALFVPPISSAAVLPYLRWVVFGSLAALGVDSLPSKFAANLAAKKE